MTNIDIKQIKELRDLTGASVVECRKALEDSGGDLEKAKEILRKKGVEKAEKKSEREVKSGIIDCYTHNNRVGVLLELSCETDFVARNEEFKNLAHEICLQIVSMNPESVDELMGQEHIRDPQKKIADLIKEVIGKIGENIVVQRFTRYELGC